MANKNAVATRTQMVVALVVAGTVAVLLTAVGFWLRDWEHSGGWQRFADLGWWGGFASHLAAYLALGKVGFKAGLAVVIGLASLAVWARRSRRNGGTDAQPSETGSVDKPPAV